MTLEDRVYVVWGDASGEGQGDEVVGYAASEEGAQDLLNDVWSGWIDILSVEDIYDLVGMGGADPQAESEAREAYQKEGLRGLLEYLNAHYRG